MFVYKIIYVISLFLLFCCKEQEKKTINSIESKTLKNDTIKDMVSNNWYGNYSLDFSRKRDHAPTMFWEHKFSIKKDSCIYEGSGFQFETKYKCNIKQNKDTLFIYADIHRDGYEKYDKNDIIMKLYKIKNSYYTNTEGLKPEESLDKPSKFGYVVSYKKPDK